MHCMLLTLTETLDSAIWTGEYTNKKNEQHSSQEIILFVHLTLLNLFTIEKKQLESNSNAFSVKKRKKNQEKKGFLSTNWLRQEDVAVYVLSTQNKRPEYLSALVFEQSQIR